MPVSFVMFDSRWGAAVCTQTQQSKNPTQWLTDWAPEPRDVYWQNFAIPFFSLSIRRFLIYRICAITCQSWGSWKGCSISEAGNRSKCGKILPSGVSSRFGSEDLSLYPTVLVIMSKVEGYVSLSSLERRTASKYYYFMLVNVFLGSIIAGTAFEQLYAFLHQLLCDQSRTRRNYNRMAMAYTWFFLEIVCATISMKIPFCKGWMCKSECWLQKKLRKVALKEHKCTKGGIRGRCHCLVCKDVPRLN